MNAILRIYRQIEILSIKKEKKKIEFLIFFNFLSKKFKDKIITLNLFTYKNKQKYFAKRYEIN